MPEKCEYWVYRGMFHLFFGNYNDSRSDLHQALNLSQTNDFQTFHNELKEPIQGLIESAFELQEQIKHNLEVKNELDEVKNEFDKNIIELVTYEKCIEIFPKIVDLFGDEARSVFLKMSIIAEAKLGPNHPTTLTICNYLDSLPQSP